jgi:hypothetical protein
MQAIPVLLSPSNIVILAGKSIFRFDVGNNQPKAALAFHSHIHRVVVEGASSSLVG